MVAAVPRLQIPALPDPQTSPRLTRAEAARINGARSRGPITDAGKRASSRNSLKHGLLAKRVSPLADSRGEQADYRTYLKELMEEYDPQTRTELNLVEVLARDWVRLGRICQYTETIMDPGDIRVDLPMARRNEAEHQLGVMTELVTRFQNRQPLEIAAEDVGWVREAVHGTADRMREEAARFRQYLAAGTEEDHPLTREQADLYRKVRPKRLGVFDEATLTAVLTDQRQIVEADRPQWQMLLEQVLTGKKNGVHFADREEARHERQCRIHQASVVRRLDELSLLQDYEERCRRGMEKTTAMLLEIRRRREERSLGSFIGNRLPCSSD